MGRKGGGRAAFMKKAQMPTDGDGASSESGEDRAENMAGGDEAGEARPAVAPTVGGEHGCEVDEVEVDGGETSGNGAGWSKEETKGQMTQRHKREMKSVKDQMKRLGKAKKGEGQRFLAEMEARHARELEALEGSSGERDVLKEMEDLSFYSNAEAKKSKGPARNGAKSRVKGKRRRPCLLEPCSAGPPCSRRPTILT